MSVNSLNDIWQAVLGVLGQNPDGHGHFHLV